MIEFNSQEIVIIGATASGKSALAMELAEKNNGWIFSIDSLAIYKKFDIVSAKPSKTELNKIKHFGIDELEPNKKSDVTNFIKIYQKAKNLSFQAKKKLIIVGGTSFYLKTLLTGISELPPISEKTKKQTELLLNNLSDAYNFLASKDNIFAQNIQPTDKYRIEKGLNIIFETNYTPTNWFKLNPPKPIISKNIPIFNLQIPRNILVQRIYQRVQKMVESGLVDEVKNIIEDYGENIQPAKAIGVKETIKFLNGEINSIEKLIEEITIHTRQFAKRQTTFNRTQFKEFNLNNIQQEI